MKKLSAAALAVSLALLLCGCAVTNFGSYEDRGFTAAVGVVSAGDADEIRETEPEAEEAAEEAEPVADDALQDEEADVMVIEPEEE